MDVGGTENHAQADRLRTVQCGFSEKGGPGGISAGDLYEAGDRLGKRLCVCSRNVDLVPNLVLPCTASLPRCGRD